MHTKHGVHVTSSGHGRPLRAERRAAEREAARAHRTHQPSTTTRLPLAIVALLVVAALGIIGWVLVRGQETPIKAAAPRSTVPTRILVSPSDFNPAYSLRKVGSVAPNFTVQDTTSDTYSLSEARGHALLLEFFAVWCPRCHEETPVMHRLAATYGAKGARVWAILSNPYGQNYEISQGRDLSPATSKDLLWYRHTYKVNYPLLVDRTFRAVNPYGGASYPTIYILNPAGRITYAHSGTVPYATLARELERASKMAAK